MDKLRQNLKRKEVFLPLIYIILLGGTVLFVRDVLGDDTIQITEEEKPAELVEEKIVKPSLTVKDQNGNVIASYNVTYKENLKNIDSVEDLFEKLRQDHDFTYKTTSYTYGVEISSINNIQAPEGFHWEVLKNGENITYRINEESIEDEEAIFEIFLSKKPQNLKPDTDLD